VSALRAVEQDDDIIGIAGEGGALLPCTTVDAVCTRVDTVYFARYQRHKLVLNFSVYSPPEFEGVKLQMFLRLDKRWTKIPRSASLYKAALIATGRRIDNEKIRKSWFKSKAYRCSLRTVGSDTGAYSVIDSIVERLTL
jgi:hypothetical protein